MVHAMSFNTLNYSGALFNKGNIRTPLSSRIGGNQYSTNHVKFTTNLDYATDESGTIPNISEQASLVAPEFTPITREQFINVTQIFQESVAISDAKRSNMGTLSGINIAGQTANPPTELDFQVAGVMRKISRQIENAFVNGVYSEATSDTTVNKTRGLDNAITTNVIDNGGNPLGFWAISGMIETIRDAQADYGNLTILCNTTTLMQINAEATVNGLWAPVRERTREGIRVWTIMTPLGDIDVMLGEFIPDGTAFFLNLSLLAPVHQPVPGKGNFYMEELGKQGAGEEYHIFGQIGLDYGAEWWHGKITGIAETFTPPANSYIPGGTNP